jgi:hypothetical protein
MMQALIKSGEQRTLVQHEYDVISVGEAPTSVEMFSMDHSSPTPEG